MSNARPDQLRLLAPDQEADALAVVHDLLTGDTKGVPQYLAEDIAAVRAQSMLTAVKISGEGGVQLDALAAWPLGDGPHPLIVLPAGLDQSGWKMYSGAIIRLLMRRYAVVAYTERGLADSGGELTVAGPEDVEDGAAVIDWALAHPQMKVDADKVGMAGISYGSGISQLVANRHPAVKAVVALSTWADLGEALYDNQTPHIKAADALASISEHPSAELLKVLDDFRNNTNIEGVLEYAKPRSPAQVSPSEQRAVPTFFTTYWHETIFPQNQLLEYFTRYPGPKRLDIAVGDHGAVEIPGALLGVYTRTTEAAYDWFDHYLRGVDNGIDQDGAVHTESMYSFTLATAPDLESWPNPQRRYYFTTPNAGSPDGTLTLEPPQSFTQSIRAGDQHVDAASALVTDGFLERLLMPRRQKLAEVDRTAAAVWTTPHPFLTPHHIAGLPEVRLTVTPATESATVIAYLFDFNPFTGNLRIVTHAAASVQNHEPGRPAGLAFQLKATDYRIPIGHKLAVIIGAKDPLYRDESDTGSTITLSTTQSPAYIDIPIRS
ncbi:CocE/NonD family hydrolase [Nocardia sp. NPDC020380]|uniref:CocE/NonD family hydrolase n=1 Tax=Nocardia sp. NPDC020380 TaxID=3364309 RepID=UPI00378AFFD7